MNIYILNNLGKKIFVRAVSKPSDTPGVLNDLVLELHAKMPKKNKDTIAILRVENEDAEWFSDQNPDASIQIDNKLDWKLNFKLKKEDGDVILELTARNGKSF